MCGIAGFLTDRLRADAGDILAAMAARLHHRGPDEGGMWRDDAEGVALAHRRLAVIDLSSAGHQPMVSADGRYVIAFNGEIYNHLSLRRELDQAGTAPAWRGHSDTETILAVIGSFGIDEGLRRLTGMFAFAMWDRQERRLTLARDRLGEKPLYYGWCGDMLLFASELKAIRSHPGWHGEIERGALASYMRLGYVPLPHSIYRGIRKLIPGTYVVISGAGERGVLPEPQTYWSAREAAARGEETELSDGDAVDQLELLLRQAVGGQMVSDVPLGAFLSGGVDSSTVVALMQAQSARPVKTFSIGFTEADYDEARYAKAVAAHLGTEHTELLVTPADALTVIPSLPEIYDEPFGDSSGIPTYLVARLARRHVTVSLSGDGGDELFGGYNRYLWGRSLWHRIGHLPLGLRRLAARTITSLPAETWDHLASPLGVVLPRRLRQRAIGDKLHKLAEVMDVASAEDLHRRLISQQRQSRSIVIGADDATATWADAEAAKLERYDFCERMMFHDLLAYLCDDILTKVDRAAMAVSLETRVPLLDHRVLEFAWKVPLHMKIRNRQGKWLLRQVLYRHVPPELIERPKQGFGIPLDSWLRGPLRDWAEALLDPSRLQRDGYLESRTIGEKWREHLSGRRNWQHWLWNVLMFQAWLEHEHD
ncbi:MAG TPA: asparagine synthase (glutamine-hydrolyzing) [Hyphomicrobium sp.]|nr:asparagine synthase (glutamine-hydrolyzing) [Hyphomicrobium sp.]